MRATCLSLLSLLSFTFAACDDAGTTPSAGPDVLTGSDTSTPAEDTAPPAEDTATSRGACDNAADMALFTSQEAIQGHVSTCITQCLTSGQLNASCYGSCMQTNAGFSAPCSGCFGEVMNCTVTNCALQCITPTSAACTTCRDEKCTPAFETCSGLVEP